MIQQKPPILSYLSLLQIFCYLDLNSLISCMRTCKAFNTLINEKLWRHLTIRDYYHFLCTKPLPEKETIRPTHNTIGIIYETEEESSKTITNPLKDPLTDAEKEIFIKKIASINDFKAFYVYYHKCLKFNGYWVANEGNNNQVGLIRIYQKGYKVYAKKLTGSPSVPAGKLTWRMTLGESLKAGKGELHLANQGFKNSRWCTACFDLKAKNVIEITVFQTGGGFMVSRTFGLVRAGHQEANKKWMEVIIKVE